MATATGSSTTGRKSVRKSSTKAAGRANRIKAALAASQKAFEAGFLPF